jgi:DNA recombination protein RmuC
MNNPSNYLLIYVIIAFIVGALVSWLLTRRDKEIHRLQDQLEEKTEEYLSDNKKIASLTQENKFLNERLTTQKDELRGLQLKFSQEFELMAAKILEEKSEKFTDLNKKNMSSLIGPLGEEINQFKKKVNEVYDKESRERFSLGREVEKLVVATQKISTEANNLTNALTAKGKTQGDWGQMILESLLEQSGLIKDHQYFVQEYLIDEQGNYLVNEMGQRMQPDVIVVFPDNRKIIIDSKVSLTSYNRYVATQDKDEENRALTEHLRSIRRHIDDLSAKCYQDFAPTLDFVMMFVPVEPAFLIAIHHDQELWSYAYQKRIILSGPSNLILALKMILDHWRRDDQDKNHMEIVERGGKLHDKFVNVLSSIKVIGSHIKSSLMSYNQAISQMNEGNDNVIRQVEKLKTLGAKAKNTLPVMETIPVPANDTETPSLPSE